LEPGIPAKHVAEAVVHVANLPLEANIPFVTIMTSGMHRSTVEGKHAFDSRKDSYLACPRLLRKVFYRPGKRSR
jgi:hypothetical protein